MSDGRMVTVFENAEGERAYQPTLAGGSRLYDDYTACWHREPPDRVWAGAVPQDRLRYFTPVLYRSERRAHRKAVREQERLDKRNRETYREVQGDD